MAPIAIRNHADLTLARNYLRRRTAGNKWKPAVRVRAATALTMMAEHIIESNSCGGIDIHLVSLQDCPAVELICNYTSLDNDSLDSEPLKRNLELVSDQIQTSTYNGMFLLTVRVTGGIGGPQHDKPNE